MSDLQHEDASREDGYKSACWRRALGRAGPWTQHNVFSNQPSVRRHRFKGGHRASRRQVAASSLDSHWGDHRCSHDLAAVAAARDKELRVERARSYTLAAQHATLSNELKRVQESSAKTRRANNALLQAVSNAGTASQFDGLQKREEVSGFQIPLQVQQSIMAKSRCLS